MDPRDMSAYVADILRGQSHAEIIGPIADVGGENGLVLRGGELVREWGDTERVDMCFSVAKSFLSAVAGLAFDRELIADLHEPVSRPASGRGRFGASPRRATRPRRACPQVQPAAPGATTTCV